MIIQKEKKSEQIDCLFRKEGYETCKFFFNSDILQRLFFLFNNCKKENRLKLPPKSSKLARERTNFTPQMNESTTTTLKK